MSVQQGGAAVLNLPNVFIRGPIGIGSQADISSGRAVLLVADRFEQDGHTGVDVQLYANGAGPFGAFVGLSFTVTSEAGDTPSRLVGVNGEVAHVASGELSVAYGAQAAVENIGDGIIDDAYGLWIRTSNDGIGTIGNAYGVYVRESSPGIGNDYGVYIGDRLGGGTSAYATYTNAGLNSFGDDLEFRNDSDGPILTDRTTATRYRLFVDNGVLGVEAV